MRGQFVLDLKVLRGRWNDFTSRRDITRYPE